MYIINVFMKNIKSRWRLVRLRNQQELAVTAQLQQVWITNIGEIFRVLKIIGTSIYINDISKGSLNIISTNDICNCVNWINTPQLQMSFFWLWNVWKYWSELVQFFMGNQKYVYMLLLCKHICSPWNPKKRYTFFGVTRKAFNNIINYLF